eukprot:TRINITY_DN1002_c0_g1_i1.p1 TRINITY_DN1002_c0_g1~~TRINITY_DN1002_c0_g1_i1.p1  ORF type:complete len:249 (+),score=45.47 TRINITY_DN1002_c0_g1_i1:75-821(+)
MNPQFTFTSATLNTISSSAPSSLVQSPSSSSTSSSSSTTTTAATATTLSTSLPTTLSLPTSSAPSSSSSWCGSVQGAVAQSEHRDHGRGGACGVKRAGVRRCSCPLCVRPRPECLADAEPTWLQIIRVVFWCLADLYPEIAFFSLREHVYPFLDLHWDAICTEKHKKDNWKKSLQDTLSHAECLESGKSVFGQNGIFLLTIPLNRPNMRITHPTFYHHHHHHHHHITHIHQSSDHFHNHHHFRLLENP